MAFFGLDGKFGSWMDNPKFMSPDFLGVRGSNTGAVRPGGGPGQSRLVKPEAPGGQVRNPTRPYPALPSGDDELFPWEVVPRWPGQMMGGGTGTGPTPNDMSDVEDWDEFYKRRKMAMILRGDRPTLDLAGLLGKAGWKGGGVPEKWDGGASIAKAKVDPMSVINAAKPGIMEEMNRGFASAAMRQGATGAMMGSGYSQALGGVARKAANDIGQVTMDTLFKSSESAADREQQALESARDRSLSAWGTHGNWEADAGKEYFSNLMGLLGMFGGNLDEYNVDFSGLGDALGGGA